MTDSVFNENAEVPVTADQLIGDGKKFKTVDDLAKGKLEADNFIEQLKREQTELRAELNKRLTAEDQANKLREELRQSREDTSQNQPRENTSPSLTAADVKALVAQTITETEQTRSTAQNITKANEDVIKHFGAADKAIEAVKAKARELGVSVDFLRDVAAKSPSAFNKIVLGDVKSETVLTDVTRSTVRVDPSVSAGNAKEGTREFYNEMRRTNPKLYFAPSTQQAILKAAQAGTYIYE